MAPNDLDPNNYIPVWRLLLGRAWLTPQQRREVDKAAAAPTTGNPPAPRCCAETCCA